tara:strand:- start:146 stop:1453 length:1308 start_codon:yes stop_codon:yes gene_type:complete
MRVISIKKYFEYYLSYLIILLPILLITGPFLTDLSISILAVTSIFLIKNKKYFFNFYFLFFIFFYFLIIISSTFSDNVFLSFESSLFYFRFGLFSIIFWYLIENNKKILKKLYFILLVSFVVLMVDTFYQYLNDFNLLNMPIIYSNRLSSLFGDELILGSYLTRLFPLILALHFFIYKKKINRKYIIFKILFLFSILSTIYLSGERSSFFLFNFSIILFLIFLNDLRYEKILIFLSYLSVVFFLIFLETPFKKRLVNQTLNQSGFLIDNKEKFIFSRQHQEHYVSAWRMYRDNKFLGIGPKNFRVKCSEPKYRISEFTCSTHPHNTYIQLLAETGFIGFLIIFLLLMFIIFLLIKNFYYKIRYKKNIYNNLQISLMIAILISLWPITSTGNFFNNWLSVVYFMPVGILLWSFKENRRFYISMQILRKKLIFLHKF